MSSNTAAVEELTAGLVSAALKSPELIHAIIYAASNLYARATLRQGLQSFEEHTRAVFKLMEAGGLEATVYIPPTKKH
jgi:hypothetical protein